MTEQSVFSHGGKGPYPINRQEGDEMLLDIQQTAASLGILDGRLWRSWLAPSVTLGSLPHNAFFASRERYRQFLDVSSEVGTQVLRIQASGLRMCLPSLAVKNGQPQQLPIGAEATAALANAWVGMSQQVLDAGFAMARGLSPFLCKEGATGNDPDQQRAIKTIPVRQGVSLENTRSGVTPDDKPAAFSLWAEVMRAATEEDPLLREDDDFPRAA